MNHQTMRALTAILLGNCGAQAVAADVTLVRSQQQGTSLVTVDSGSPATVKRTVQMSGLAVGERLIGFDARPAANRALYGLGSTGQVYVINGVTGAATAIGTLNSILRITYHYCEKRIYCLKKRLTLRPAGFTLRSS